MMVISSHRPRRSINCSTTPLQSGPQSMMSPKTTRVSVGRESIALTSVLKAVAQPWMSPIALSLLLVTFSGIGRAPRRVKLDATFFGRFAMGRFLLTCSRSPPSQLTLLVGLDDLIAMDFKGGEPAPSRGVGID